MSNQMTTEKLIEHLEIKIQGLIYEHQCMPKFFTIENLKKAVEEEFFMEKKYQEFINEQKTK